MNAAWGVGLRDALHSHRLLRPCVSIFAPSHKKRNSGIAITGQGTTTLLSTGIAKNCWILNYATRVVLATEPHGISHDDRCRVFVGTRNSIFEASKIRSISDMFAASHRRWSAAKSGRRSWDTIWFARQLQAPPCCTISNHVRSASPAPANTSWPPGCKSRWVSSTTSATTASRCSIKSPTVKSPIAQADSNHDSSKNAPSHISSCRSRETS